MTLLKCNYLILTNLFFCYFYSYCYNFKISGKKLHLFTLFSITSHCFSLFLVDSKSMLALLPFKATTITPRHSNDKCFHMAGGDLICQSCVHASHFQKLVRNKKSSAWQYVPPDRWFEECDGVSECQSLHDSDTVKTSKLKNVRSKLNLCLLRRHLYTIQCHVTKLWYRSWLFGTFNWPCLPSWIGIFHSEMAVTARAGLACTQFKTKHQSKRQRVLPAYMALHKIAGCKRF